MKNIIIKRIEVIKGVEDGFNNEYWSNSYVSTNYTEESILLKDLDVEKLNDENLVKIFEYIIRQHSDISDRRVKHDYFNSGVMLFKDESEYLRADLLLKLKTYVK